MTATKLLLTLATLLSTAWCAHGLGPRSRKPKGIKGRRNLDTNDDKFAKEEKEEKEKSRKSQAPTTSPAPTATLSPSANPTASLPPTPGIYQVTTQVADTFGNTFTKAQCENPQQIIPLQQEEPDSTFVVDQLISYEYYMWTTGNPVTAARFVETALQTQLARKMLDCDVNRDELKEQALLEFWSLSSEPLDELYSNDCGVHVEFNNNARNCFVIRGGFTADFFSLASRRRQLEEHDIGDVRIVDTLDPILRDMFSNGQLKDSYSEITDLQFVEFTNIGFSKDPNDTSTTSTDRGTGSATDLTSTTSPESESMDALPAIALSFVAVALVALIILAVRRRRFAQEQELKEQVDSIICDQSKDRTILDDASLAYSLRSGVHAPLKYRVGQKVIGDIELDGSGDITSKSDEEIPPPIRKHRLRDFDTRTSCGMDMELMSDGSFVNRCNTNDSSLFFPYEDSREQSGYSYNKGPGKVYVLNDCASFEESTINLGPNFNSDVATTDGEDSFRQPIFVKPNADTSELKVVDRSVIDDLQPHRSLSFDDSRRYYATEDTVVL